MRGAAPETWFGENKTDCGYPEGAIEISKEQVFAELVRTVRERVQLRDRKYPTDNRWKRIVPRTSYSQAVADEDTDQRNARHLVRAIGR